MSPASSVQHNRTILVLTFLALIVPLLAIGVLGREGPRIRDEALANLAAIGRLKAEQIEAWLGERRGDAEMIMASEGYIDDAQRWLDHRDPDARTRIAQRDQALLRIYGYQDIEWLDARVPADSLPPDGRALLDAALVSCRVQTGELYRDKAGEVWLDFVAPLIKRVPTGNKTVGAVKLRTRADSHLFPFIQTWPTTSPSAETLLLRRDGDNVLFLNALRHRQGTSMNYRLPLASPDLPAAIAVRDKRAKTLEGRDYRGIPVLATAHPVQGTNWFLVPKIDMDEVQRPLYQLVTWVSIVALAVLIVVVILRRLWLQQARNHRLELIARTGERDRLLNLFYNLPFMGMAIIDPKDQRWLHVNDQLCEILGYSREELLTSTTWNRLTHSDDLAVDMTNYQRMLAGEINGYQIEKRCIRKGGDFVDVALSVKCLRRADGSVEYVVKTVRDISDRKQLNEARTEHQRSANLLYAIADTSTDAIFAKDREGRYLFYNRAAAQDVGKRCEEVIGHDDIALFPAELARDIMARDREVMAGGKPITFEEALATTEGERTFLTTKGPLLDGDGKVIGLYGISRDITERKFSEERVRRNQEQLQLFIEHAPISIAMFDRGMNYLAHSRRWLEDYGCGHVSLVGRNHYDVKPDMPDEWRKVHVRGLAGETVKNDADHWLRADGSEHWLRWAVLPWNDVQGAIGGIIITVEDITDRRRAEEALRYQLDLIRGIMEKSTDSIFINDAEGRVTALNAEAERAFGYRAEELVGRVLHDIIHHHHRDGRPFPMQECPLCHVYKTGEMIRDHEAIVFRRDGSRMFITGSNAVLESQGKLLGAALILHDITELKQAEQALREHEQDLTRAQAVGRIGSWRLDVLRNELNWSAENHRIFGIPEGTPLTYETFLTCVHPEDRARVDQAWQAGVSGAPYDVEHRLLVNGQVKWVREKAEMEFDAEGNLLGGFGISQDISDIKAAEQALRDSEERFQLASEIGRSGAWDWDVPSGGIVWSRGHFEILGYRVDEVQPSYQAWADRVHPEDLARIETEIQRSMRERVDYVVEFRVVWPDGSIHWMSSRGRYQYDQDGTCQRMLGVMADITSLKQAELALREADQRKDEFLAMLAHELRNPLAPIRNAAHVLGRLELEEPRLRWAQDIIERQVAHLTHLVDELLDISRIVRGKITLKKTRVELADLVRQTRESVQPTMAAKGHRFEVRMPEEPVVLEGDMVRLVQVLQNLLNNAAKYTPDGGHIELLAQLGQSEIEILVRDNGMGISTNLLPSMFDLFRQGERTLDRSQGGLGIGLTLVRRLVELHGGQVSASSAGPGQGASFRVRLPLATGSVASPTPVDRDQAKATARQALRILVVEDDPVVSESMVVFLELEGYQVRSAAAAEAALELLTEFRPRVALIDIGLPGQDGYTLARRIRQREDGAGVTLLAVSGYGQEEAIKRSLQAGFDQHLVKPVDPGVLCDLLVDIGKLVTRPMGKNGNRMGTE